MIGNDFLLPPPAQENFKNGKSVDRKEVIPTSIPFIGMTTQPKNLVTGYEPKTLVVSFDVTSWFNLIFVGLSCIFKNIFLFRI